MKDGKISLLFPDGEKDFRLLPEVSVHDLGIDFLCQKVTGKNDEQSIFMQFFSKMSGDPKTAQYRSDIFDDIFNNPEMSSQLIKVLEHINYEKQ